MVNQIRQKAQLLTHGVATSGRNEGYRGAQS